MEEKPEVKPASPQSPTVISLNSALQEITKTLERMNKLPDSIEKATIIKNRLRKAMIDLAFARDEFIELSKLNTC